MTRKVVKDVFLTDKDYWGDESSIIFRPSDAPGWHWEYESGKDPVLITAELLQSKRRRLALEYENRRLNIFEHLGVLKWCGFNDLIVRSNEWPPYYGRSWEFYDFLRANSRTTNGNPGWCTVSREICFEYKKGGNLDRHIRIIPSDSRSLELFVTCDYSSLGCRGISFILPGHEYLLERILKAYTQGWPPLTGRLLSWTAEKLLGWPHRNKVIWPRRHNGAALELFVFHRALDLLGALSIIHPTRLLSAKVISYCSGHQGDVEVIRQAQNFLVPLEP